MIEPARKILGIIPAAGLATRMNGLPKMILPTPNCDSLIGRLVVLMDKVADIVYIATRPTNYDLLERIDYNGDVVLYRIETNTMSETVRSFSAVKSRNDVVVFGMPDTYFEDTDAFSKLIAELDRCDVAVGVFTTRPNQRERLGMCDIDDHGRVTRILDKQKSDLTLAWGILAWKDSFWKYINSDDPHVGYAVQRAIENNQIVHAVKMDGGYYDAGTPGEYFELVSYLWNQ